MMAFAAFEDERLDANLATILRLPHMVDGEASPTLHRVRGSRRASVTVVAALSLAVCGAVVALFVGGRDAPPTGVTASIGNTPDQRQIIDLDATAVIRLPPDTAAPADIAATVTPVHATSRRQLPLRSSSRNAVASAQLDPAETPSPSPTDLATVSPAPIHTRVAAADTYRPAAPTPSLTPAPVYAPPPPAAATDDTIAAKRDRRDSVSAIRSLRRQW